ncbi:MAG TPA: hypothetical protein VMX12_01775 [Acidimicrobiia bacterium]|nr:hypothetical protein [Acidimicrobiia bacterium]
MTDVQARNREVLDAVRVRRDSFYEALLELEQALGTPAGADVVGWAAAVHVPVANLLAVLDAHVTGTEGNEGFFTDVRDHAPHLIPAVERLRSEHDPLIVATASLAARLDGLEGEVAVEQVRDDGIELIGRLLTHRHRGAELVYDAYSIDVSTGD